MTTTTAINHTVSAPRTVHAASATRWRRKAQCVAVILSCCVGLAQCAQSETPSVNTEQAVGIEVEAPRVTVVDPGAQPLRVLQFTDSDATPQRLSLSIFDGFQQSTQQTADVDPVPQLPDLANVTAFNAELTATTQPAVNSETSTRSTTMTVEQPTITQTEQPEDISTAHGFSFGWFSDDAGRISSLNYAAPETATDTARALTEQYLSSLVALPVIFPTDPVGPGASWTVESRITGQSTLLRTITYTATAFSDESVDLDVSVTQRPSISSLRTTPTDRPAEGEDGDNTDATAADAEVRVLSSETTSAGSLHVDFNHPLPTTGEVMFTTRVIYGNDDSTVRVMQDTATGVKFTPAV